VDECKPLAHGAAGHLAAWLLAQEAHAHASVCVERAGARQGLTLVLIFRSTYAVLVTETFTAPHHKGQRVLTLS
jgi:hypothetical protein